MEKLTKPVVQRSRPMEEVDYLRSRPMQAAAQNKNKSVAMFEERCQRANWGFLVYSFRAKEPELEF